MQYWHCQRSCAGIRAPIACRGEQWLSGGPNEHMKDMSTPLKTNRWVDYLPKQKTFVGSALGSQWCTMISKLSEHSKMESRLEEPGEKKWFSYLWKHKYSQTACLLESPVLWIIGSLSFTKTLVIDWNDVGLLNPARSTQSISGCPSGFVNFRVVIVHKTTSSPDVALCESTLYSQNRNLKPLSFTKLWFWTCFSYIYICLALFSPWSLPLSRKYPGPNHLSPCQVMGKRASGAGAQPKQKVQKKSKGSNLPALAPDSLQLPHIRCFDEWA